MQIAKGLGLKILYVGHYPKYIFVDCYFLVLIETLNTCSTYCYLNRIIELLNTFHLLLCKYLASVKA